MTKAVKLKRKIESQKMPLVLRERKLNLSKMISKPQVRLNLKPKRRERQDNLLVKQLNWPVKKKKTRSMMRSFTGHMVAD